MEPFNGKNVNPAQLSSSALAYYGDAVLERMVRRRLVLTGISEAGKLNELSRHYVQATAQSTGLDVLLPLFTEEEEAVYKRARNKSGSHPRSAAMAEYRRATGLEAVFAYLDLTEQEERLAVLFDAFCQSVEGENCIEEK